MSKYASKQFWIDTFDRSVATFAQTFVAGGALDSSGLIGLDWKSQVSIAGASALASALTSVAFRDGAQPKGE